MNPPTNSTPRHRLLPLLCLLGAASVLASQTLKDAAALFWGLALLSFAGATVLAVKRANAADHTGRTGDSRP